MTTTATETDQAVDQWATSRRGTCRIRLHEHGPGRFAVYALEGHELLPVTRRNLNLTEARAYANTLWSTR
jgi:hypothetical protein